MWFIVFHRSWLQIDTNCADESIRAFRIVASLTMLWACVAGQASRSQCLDHLDQRFVHHMQKLSSTIRGLLLLWSPLNYLQWWFWNFEDCTTGWATTKKSNVFIDFSKSFRFFSWFFIMEHFESWQKNRTLFHAYSISACGHVKRWQLRTCCLFTGSSPPEYQWLSSWATRRFSTTGFLAADFSTADFSTGWFGVSSWGFANLTNTEMHTICQMFLEADILHKFLELEAWKCPCWFVCFWWRPFANDIFLVTILFIWTLSCVVDSQNCTQTRQSDRFWHHICGTHPKTFINRLSRDSFEKRLEGDWLPGTLTLCWSRCGFMFGCSMDVPWILRTWEEPLVCWSTLCGWCLWFP